MLARLTAFTVWALVAATAVFWGLRLIVRPQPAPAYAVAVGDGAAVRGDLSRLLGAAPVAAAGGPAVPAAPELASRFKLLGVMAGKPPSTGGFALIAIDSKPARTYEVGTALDGELVLQSVSLRSAAIGPSQGTPAVTLEIPPLPLAATGTLPAIGDASRPAPSPVPPAPMQRPPPAGAAAAVLQPPPPGAPPPTLPRAPGVNTR